MVTSSTCYRTHLHITDAAGTRIDIFHLYWDDADRLAFPFGVAGTTVIRRADWHGLEEIDFSGGRGMVPSNAEQFVEHMYGVTWRNPKPGFHWRHDRVSRAADGVLADALVEEIYWANFYAHTDFDSGSTFCQLLLERDDIPSTVLDIGCGDGRDSFAFGRAGRNVTGLDRSHVGIAHAAKKSARLGLGARVDFAVCDVAHSDDTRSVVTRAIESADGPVLIYLRFFLHSIPEDVQQTLLQVLGDCVRPGDMLAAEFRTTEDEQEHKVHTRHYRRFQDGPAFGARLRDEFGYALIEEQHGRGLSVYGDEDPTLYRVLARRDRPSVPRPDPVA